MVDIPQIFNRNDFVSILLPGYVNAIAVLVIFRPGLLTFKDFSFDLFSTVLLLIAGPSLGIILRQIYRTSWLSYDAIRARKRKRKAVRGLSRDSIQSETIPPPGPTEKRLGVEDWSNEYARIRLNADPKDLQELDAAEADMDFSATTAVGIFLQGMATLVISISVWVTAGLFAMGLVLGIGAYLEWLTSFGPIYNAIASKMH